MGERVRLLKSLVGVGVNPFSLCNAVSLRARQLATTDPGIRVARAINRAIGEFASGALTCQAGSINAKPEGLPEAPCEAELQAMAAQQPEPLAGAAER